MSTTLPSPLIRNKTFRTDHSGCLPYTYSFCMRCKPIRAGLSRPLLLGKPRRLTLTSHSWCKNLFQHGLVLISCGTFLRSLLDLCKNDWTCEGWLGPGSLFISVLRQVTWTACITCLFSCNISPAQVGHRLDRYLEVPQS